MSDMVTVAVASNATEAGLYRATLEQAGIPAFVADEGIVSQNWFLSNAVGGIKVRVAASDADAARELLETSAVAVVPEEAAFLAKPATTCPSCGSSLIAAYTRAQGRNILASVASFFLLPVPVPFKERRLQCNSCGVVFRRPKEP